MSNVMTTSVRWMMLLLLGAVCAVSPGVDAQARDVSGRWHVTFAFDSPVSGALVLKQQGEAVTGQLNTSFTGEDMPVEGEISDGELTLSGSTTTGPHPGLQLDFTASLDADDKMRGSLSWQVGDFTWTAERIK